MWENCFFFINLINSIQIKEIYSLELLTHLLKLSAVRKVLETIMFLALGSFGSKTVWETVLA